MHVHIHYAMQYYAFCNYIMQISIYMYTVYVYILRSVISPWAQSWAPRRSLQRSPHRKAWPSLPWQTNLVHRRWRLWLLKTPVTLWRFQFLKFSETVDLHRFALISQNSSVPTFPTLSTWQGVLCGRLMLLVFLLERCKSMPTFMPPPKVWRSGDNRATMPCKESRNSPLDFNWDLAEFHVFFPFSGVCFVYYCMFHAG